MSPVQIGNLAVPGAGLHHEVLELGPRLISRRLADAGGVSHLSQQLARRSRDDVPHDVRSHMKT